MQTAQRNSSVNKYIKHCRVLGVANSEHSKDLGVAKIGGIMPHTMTPVLLLVICFLTVGEEEELVAGHTPTHSLVFHPCPKKGSYTKRQD